MDTRNEMRVEEVKEDENKVTVVTTGAKYIIDKSGENGKISCYQRLSEERLIATVDFNYPFATLSVEKQDDSTCVLHQTGKTAVGHIRLQINSDSLLDIHLLDIYSGGRLYLTFSGNFLPDYSVEKDGHVLLIDEIGGIGVYPYQGLGNVESADFNCREWKIKYTLDNHCRFLISVLPPRKFNYAQSFQDRITLHASWIEPYPPNEMIEEARKYANILGLHAHIWQGKYTRNGKPVTSREDAYANAPFGCFDYLPVDEKELIRVIKKAHSLGMRVIPYMSPCFSMAKGGDFLDRVEDVLEKYEMDGVYFDGISYDILYSYQMIRDTRKLLKDKILYVHCTDDPLMSKNIYCPFIDTYADYILRAEHLTSFTDKYLRYVISGYNISNSIGHVCYYDYPLDFVRGLIDKALAVNARVSPWLPETEREKLLKKEYFPKLELLSSNSKKFLRKETRHGQ